MSIVKSSAESLTLNADGSGNDVIIQSNGSTKVTVDGQNSRVGIGTASPILPLSIKASQEQLTISEGDARGGTFDYRSSTGNLQIATNGANARSAPQLTLNLNGDITANTGDIVFGTGGKGIVLGATSNTAANTLSDYEEGTWTPACSRATVSGIEKTRYTKIGRLVHVFAYFQLAADGTGHNISFTGLPFTVENEIYETGIVQFSKNSTSRGILSRTGGNSTTIDLMYTDGDQAQVPADSVDGGHVMISLTYNVA